MLLYFCRSYLCAIQAGFVLMQHVSFVSKKRNQILYRIPISSSRGLFIAWPICVSFFFSESSLLMCYFYNQFALSLPFWLPSNGPRDLIGQGYAFEHLDSESSLANEFCVFRSQEAASRWVDLLLHRLCVCVVSVKSYFSSAILVLTLSVWREIELTRLNYCCVCEFN